jgi:16S rRNA (cytosine967-C5)-methyltransferase
VSPARAAAFDILLRVEREDAYASELLHSSRLDSLSQADRGLTTEIVMGVLRWRSRLDSVVTANSSRPLTKLDAEVLLALRIAAYQILFLSRVPTRAAINESVELVKRARKTSAAGFVNAVLRVLSAGGLAVDVPDSAGASSASDVAEKFAHPQWLVDRWARNFGINQAEAVCEYDQRIPETAIRVEDEARLPELESEGVQFAPGKLLTAARVVTAGEITQTHAFREGRVFIQDEASQLIALLVGRGSRILDCCAAPGSKTAAIAARNPDAAVVAAELHPHRAELLRQRVRAANVQVVTADAIQLETQADFDRVLADVPCSGTGTLARNPEIKWRLKPEDLPDLHGRQVAILRSALKQLASGGRTVYSTCSLEPEENDAVVEEVLAAHPEYGLLDFRAELEQLHTAGELALEDFGSLLSGQYLRTLPGVHPCDGFFAAVIERTHK